MPSVGILPRRIAEGERIGIVTKSPRKGKKAANLEGNASR
jgi:hypothetical protein